MEENKEQIDKLKQALNSKLSNGDLARRLKQKSELPKQDSIKLEPKKEIKEEPIELVETTIEEKEPIEIDTYIEEFNEVNNNEQTIQKKLPPQKGNLINSFIYFLSFISILLFIFALYIYNSDTKEKVVYKDKEPVEVIKEVVKEKVVFKQEFDEKAFKEFFNKDDYDAFKCYEFEQANSSFPISCKKSLEEFMATNNNSIKYEIISVISEDDEAFFNGSKYENLSKNEKEYLIRGFSRQRVLESTFFIKQHLNEDAILIPTNYYVKSQKNNKGIILKAFK